MNADTLTQVSILNRFSKSGDLSQYRARFHKLPKEAKEKVVESIAAGDEILGIDKVLKEAKK